MADTSLGTSRISPRRSPRRGATLPAAQVSEALPGKNDRLSKIVLAVLIAMVLPSIFFIGPLKLNFYKVVLLLTIIPLVVQWLSQKAGPPKGIDFLVMGFAVWCFISLMVVHGFSAWERGGIVMVETLGAYLMGRVYIRSPGQFRSFVKTICIIIIALLPFAFVETLTSRIPINDIMGLFTGVNPDGMDEMRLGLHRVQGPFEHPILFGVFCATMTAPAFLVWGYGLEPIKRLVRISVALVATFLSLSMGAYISVVGQIALFTWDYMLRKVQGRWMILFAIFVAFYILIDLFSNRTPIQVFISYLSFNTGASWNRILIWEYGSAEVLRHPIFGIGNNDWTRPHWMVASVDNFWLLMAMQYGLPAFLFLISAFIRTIYATGRLDFSHSPLMRDYRLAYLVSLGGLMLSLCTVHVWNATYIFLMMFLGAGVWMRDYVVPEPTAATSDTEDETENTSDKPRYYSPRRNRDTLAPSHNRQDGRRSRYTRGRRPSK